MTDDTMPLEKGVYERPNSPHLWFHIKVPKALKSLYGREWAEQVSLETADRREANVKAARLRAQWLDTFERQRKEQDGQRVERMTPDLAKFLAQQVLHDTLERADVRQSVSWRKDMLSWHVRVGQVGLQTAAARVGMVIDEKTVGINEGLLVYLNELKDVLRAPLVDRPTAPKAAAKPKKLRDVFDRWKVQHMPAEGKKVPDAVTKKEAALKLYEQHTGNPPLSDLTRDMGEAFKTFVLQQEGASKTKNMRFGAIKDLLNYANRDLEWLTRNPWQGLDIPYVTQNKRDPWTLAQVKALFGLPLFTKYELPNTTASNGGPAAYWIPLLGLYTGASVSELAQLQPVDVVDRDGIVCISVNDDAEGKRLKAPQRRREVPLHSELLRLGFLEYVKEVRKAGAEWLWPALSFRADKPGGYFSGWFGRFRKTAPQKVPDFHSLRHTVRSKLAEKHFSIDLQDRITGHAIKGSAGVRVYTHYTLAVLLEAVEKIEYPGLVLSKVYKAPE